MKDLTSRSIYISTLGALIAALSIVALIWAPNDRVFGATGLMLVITTVVGIGLLIAGASAALRTPEHVNDHVRE